MTTTRTDEHGAGSDAPPTARGERRAAVFAAARRAGTDPTLIGPALMSLALSTVFVLVGLYYNQGRLIPPLDDVYIHLQYGRQLGSGFGFAYNPGDPPSTGASSLLYALILALAWAAGVQGPYFLAFAVGFGALCVAATVVATTLLGRRLAGRTVGTWAGVLTAVSGPLTWGAVSGMEVGLVAVLVTGGALAFVLEQPGSRFRVTPVVGALLALVRPEGLIVAAALVAGMLWTIVRTAWADRRPWVRAAGASVWALLPLAAGAAQLLFYRSLTGTGQANGIQAKSLLYQETLVQPTEAADEALRNLQQILSTLAGLDAQDVVPPGTAVLAVVGLVALGLERARRWRTLAVVLAVGLVLVLLSVSTLVTAQWQNQRYLQPFLPLLLVLAVVGVDAVLRRSRGTGGPGETGDAGGLGGSGDAARRSRLMHGLLAMALLFTVVYTPTWALRYAQQAATIREAPVSVANWLRGSLPPGASIAVNDVGATAYLSGHRVVDLVGLATNGMAAPSLNGAGTLYEALRHMPRDQRPDYFSIYHSWPGVPVQDLGGSRILGKVPIASFPLKSPAHPVWGFAPPPCQTDLSCDQVDVWKADWSIADSGLADRPDTAPRGVIRDYLNTGHLAAEETHGWSATPPIPGVQPQSVVAEVADPAGRTVVDSGRHVVGGETFTLRNLTPGRPVTVTGRIDAREPLPDYTTNSRAAAVTVDGRPAGTWDFATALPRAWQQSTFTIPAALVTGPELTVTTGARQELLAPYPDYVNYGIWASQ